MSQRPRRSPVDVGPSAYDLRQRFTGKIRALDNRLLKPVPVEGWNKPYYLRVRFGMAIDDLCREFQVENHVPRAGYSERVVKVRMPNLVDFLMFEPVRATMLTSDRTLREGMAAIGCFSATVQALITATIIMPVKLVEDDDCLVVGLGSVFHLRDNASGYPCLERIKGNWVLSLTNLPIGGALNRRTLFFTWREPDLLPPGIS